MDFYCNDHFRQNAGANQLLLKLMEIHWQFDYNTHTNFTGSWIKAGTFFQRKCARTRWQRAAKCGPRPLCSLNKYLIRCDKLVRGTDFIEEKRLCLVHQICNEHGNWLPGVRETITQQSILDYIDLIAITGSFLSAPSSIYHSLL